MKDRGVDAEGREPFRQGVEQFNAERFFDAHESWEAIWLKAAEPDKTFLQGITQVTAAFHHLAQGNRAGAESLLQKGLRKLEQFPANYRGIKLDQLREELGGWLGMLAQNEAGRKGLRPKIEWH